MSQPGHDSKTLSLSELVVQAQAWRDVAPDYFRCRIHGHVSSMSQA